MKKIILALTIPLLLLAACSDEEELGPENEEFHGTYMVRDLGQIAILQKKDSVVFSINKNSSYDMHFYGLDGSNNDVDFCDVSGAILDFGTPKVGFDPAFIFSGNCDTLRVPRGDFEADFKNHGDTVYIFKNVTTSSGGSTFDSLFQLILLKVD